MLFKLPKWAYYQAVGRFVNKAEAEHEIKKLDISNGQLSEDQAVEAATAVNLNGDVKKRKAKIYPRRPNNVG